MHASIEMCSTMHALSNIKMLDKMLEVIQLEEAKCVLKCTNIA